MKKTLADVLYKTGIRKTTGDLQRDILAVTDDSRKVTRESLFVAVKGLSADGHQYIDQAITQGAAAVVCQELPSVTDPAVTYVEVADSRKALGWIASNFYDQPTEKLHVVGVTGTNGKTTVAFLLYEVFTKLGHPCGLISTLGHRTGTKMLDTSYTTPDPVTLNSLLHQMAGEGCEYIFMEVSSHALDQARVEGMRFAGAIFTNITHDHLDYHQGFKEYLQAKQRLFQSLDKNAFALTNLDDKNGMIIMQNSKVKPVTYSLRAIADYKGKLLDNTFAGLHLMIDGHEVWCKLTGTFNAYNILAAYGTGRILGKAPDELLAAISGCEAPEGRFDYFTGKDNIIGIVDYAHTPDALQNVLKNIQDLRGKHEKLITVIGCGGDRDKSKRAPMATIAARYSDQVIFTSDNPRFEDPEAIIRDMVKGLELDPAMKNKYVSIVDRKEAMKIARVMARNNDIVLVAGKGHEKYQEIRGERIPFDDKAVLQELLNK